MGEPDPGTGTRGEGCSEQSCTSLLYQPPSASSAHPKDTGGTGEGQAFSYRYPYSLDSGKKKALPIHSTENRSRPIYTARKIQVRTGNSTHIPGHERGHEAGRSQVHSRKHWHMYKVRQEQAAASVTASP